jgi:magnesium transporter
VFQFTVVPVKDGKPGAKRVVSRYREIRRGELLREIRRRTAGDETYKRRRGRSISRGRSSDGRRRRGSKGLVSWGIQAIQPRDMRKIDPHFSSGVDAVLLVRRSTIMFSMAHIAAVVLHDRCYLVVPQGADSILSVMMDRLRDIEILSSPLKKEEEEEDEYNEESKNENQEKKEDENKKKKKENIIMNDKSQDGNIIPFEFLALEAMLATMRDSISKKLEGLETRARKALRKLRQNVLTQGRETLFITSEELHDVELRVNAIEKALKEVLDCDEDMACMYLTRLQEDPDTFDDPDFTMFHEEVELLLESYLQDIRGLGARAERLRFEITSTEKLVTLELDAVRNRLLQVDLALESMTMTIGFGAMIAGLFGMNLRSGKETTDGWFWGICILVFGLTVTVPPALLALFRYWFGYFSRHPDVVASSSKFW